MKAIAFSIVATVLVLVATATGFAGPQGETKYPSKDIQFICSGGAGGGADAISRKLAQILEKDIGVGFYVVNKPGADGAVGGNLLMGAKPDGYTIGIMVYGSIVNAVYSRLIEGYDLNKLDFVANVTEECDAVMVGKDTPYKTFDDLINAAKARPGQIPVADQGVGSRVNLLLFRIESKYGVEFKKVSYVSSAAQREAILNKEVEVAVTSLGDFAPLLQSGDVRGLVEFSTARNIAFPDVPTSQELKLGNDMLSSSFLAIAFPKGTAEEHIKFLEAAIQKAVTTKEFIDWCGSVGVSASFMNRDQLNSFIKVVMERDFKELDNLKNRGIIK
jgi:tripartite-type tricarboxylate transporter receptor subunit TctC